ncbi:MAG: YbjQ family protein [Oscillospiraceae bacterium]|nr:YbjQ family protein [Oscillospiraceae bacterium]
MILVTTDYISGRHFEMLGIVKGSTVQSVHAGKDIGAAFKTLVGGELQGYNDMLNNARALATKRMVMEAEEMGADAVVAMRYASAEVLQGAAEVIAYGTAVKFVDDDDFY